MHLLALRRLPPLLAALGLVAAGCGGDPPAPPPFTPSTAASSPTPTGPVKPVLPDAAKQPTAEGAEAFAEFYWEQAVNYAQATGDTGPVRAIASATCKACEGGASSIDDIYARGGVIRGGDVSVSNLRAIRLDSSPPRYMVTFKLRSTRQFIDFPGDKKDGGFKAATADYRFAVDYLDDQWRTAYWEFTQ